jgi:hypothetical protein
MLFLFLRDIVPVPRELLIQFRLRVYCATIAFTVIASTVGDNISDHWDTFFAITVALAEV